MDIVRQAQRGELSPCELADALIAWDFDPSYHTRGLADDWELRPDSFDAVVHAYVIGVIDEDTYGRILRNLNEKRPRTE